MSLLSRYLLRRALFLLLVLLLAGCGLYVLTDLFERLDRFMEADSGLWLGVTYFTFMLPSIISQILPAVVLLALIIQFHLLERSRELVALYAGGVSPYVVARFVLCYGLALAAGQFVFAQVLGTAGERAGASVWQDQVQKNTREKTSIKGLWFTEGRMIAHVGSASPALGTGGDLKVYVLDSTGLGIEEILTAETFEIHKRYWVLRNGDRLMPARYSRVRFEERQLPIAEDLKSFLVVSQRKLASGQLAPWELRQTIERLETTGVNVEALRTAWHGKFSYAASIVVMAMLALILSRMSSSLYKNISAALLVVFLFYSLNANGLKLGEKALLPPALAAWMANLCFAALCLLWRLKKLLWRSSGDME